MRRRPDAILKSGSVAESRGPRIIGGRRIAMGRPGNFLMMARSSSSFDSPYQVTGASAWDSERAAMPWGVGPPADCEEMTVMRQESGRASMHWSVQSMFVRKYSSRFRAKRTPAQRTARVGRIPFQAAGSAGRASTAAGSTPSDSSWERSLAAWRTGASRRMPEGISRRTRLRPTNPVAPVTRRDSIKRRAPGQGVGLGVGSAAPAAPAAPAF